MTCHWEWLEGATRSKIAHQTSKKKRNFTARKRCSFKPFVAICRSFYAAAVWKVRIPISSHDPLRFYSLSLYIGGYLTLRGTWGWEHSALMLLNYSPAVQDTPTSPYKPARKQWRKHLLPSSVSGTDIPENCGDWEDAKSMTAKRDKVLLNSQETSTSSVELVFPLPLWLFQCGRQENMISMT